MFVTVTLLACQAVNNNHNNTESQTWVAQLAALWGRALIFLWKPLRCSLAKGCVESTELFAGKCCVVAQPHTKRERGIIGGGVLGREHDTDFQGSRSPGRGGESGLALIGRLVCVFVCLCVSTWVQGPGRPPGSGTRLLPGSPIRQSSVGSVEVAPTPRHGLGAAEVGGERREAHRDLGAEDLPATSPPEQVAPPRADGRKERSLLHARLQA